MSRPNKHKKRTIERVSMPLQQTGSNMMVISDSMMKAIYMQQSPQKNTQGESMLPGAPLEPYKGIMPAAGPRSWNFPIGWNVGRQSRSSTDQDVPTFQQLRTLARSYDGIQMCERVWMDLIGKVQMVIKPRPDLVSIGDDEGNRKYQKDIAKYTKFFEKPDRQHYLQEWLRMAITDQLEIDALAIYMHPARDGSLYAMEIVDGTTVKPLLDDRGRRPDPPYPAYQQYLYGGLPGAWLDSRQMLYVRESPRSDSPYGISRVERIITRVNQALRKQQKDLARYTDGNIPAGILELPPGDTEWTSDQVQAYQQMFDALLAGNDAYRSRIKVMPPGTQYTGTDEKEIAAEFDKFLLNIAVADFGLSMADLSFTEDVNKSSGDSQENMTIRRTMLPLLNTYGTIFIQVIKDYFNDDRFVVGWTGFEEPEDLETKANAYKTMISSYMISPSDAARAMHQPVSCEIPIFYPTTNGPIFFEDLLDPKRRQAQNDAQMAGFQMAAQNPGQKQIGEGGNEEDDNSDSRKSTSPIQKDQNQDDPAKKSDSAGDTQSGSANKVTSKSDDASEKQVKRVVEPTLQTTESENHNETILEKETPIISTSTRTNSKRGDTRAESTDNTDGESSNARSESRTAIHAELKRWRTCALHDIKSGKSVRAFESDILPLATRTSISSQLENWPTAEEIRAIFQRAGNTIEEPTAFLAIASLEGAAQSNKPNGDHQAKSKLLWSSVSQR